MSEECQDFPLEISACLYIVMSLGLNLGDCVFASIQSRLFKICISAHVWIACLLLSKLFPTIVILCCLHISTKYVAF